MRAGLVCYDRTTQTFTACEWQSRCSCASQFADTICTSELRSRRGRRLWLMQQVPSFAGCGWRARCLRTAGASSPSTAEDRCRLPHPVSTQVEEGASLVFDAAGADFYQLWVAEPLPTYSRGQDVGSTLRYRAHLDCDGCRCVSGSRRHLRRQVCSSRSQVLAARGYRAHLDCDGCQCKVGHVVRRDVWSPGIGSTLQYRAPPRLQWVSVRPRLYHWERERVRKQARSSTGQSMSSMLRYHAERDCDVCHRDAHLEGKDPHGKPGSKRQRLLPGSCQTDACLPVTRNVTVDGGGTIDGGGDRWWAMWAAKQHGDSDASDFLSRDR